MDFHSLTRKELQALCKRNKIPANMTNVAMADALKSLENVDGLNEILNQLESNPSQSPEKAVPESPQIPRTATTTSTRRKKPTKEEHESSQPLTRTRRTTTRPIAEELYQENKDVNIPLTPAVPTTRRKAPARRMMETTHVKGSEEDEKLVVQEKGDVFDTPAVQGGRKRAPVVPSSRRKMESEKKEEGSVQRVYSTRRSVRLLEKNMGELSLKEKGRTEPMKMHVLDEVEEKKKHNMSGSDLQTTSDEVSEKTDDSEICAVQNLNVSLENKGEVKDDVQEIKKRDDCEAKPEVGVSVLDVKDEAYDGKTDVLLGENSEKAIEMNDAVVDGKESSLKQEIDNLVSVEESVEPNPLSLSSFGDQAENPENECQKLEDKQETNMDVAEDDHHINDDPELQFSSEEESDGIGKASDENPSEEESDSDNDAEADQEDLEDGEQLEINMDVAEDDHHVSDDPELQFSTEEESDGNDEVSDENSSEEESDSDNDAGSQKSVVDQLDMQAAAVAAEEESINVDNGMVVPYSLEDLKTEMEKYDTESLVDVNVIEAEDFAMAPKSSRQIGPFCPLVSDSEVAANIPLPKIQELGNSANLIDIYVIPEVEFGVTTHVGGKDTGGIPLSPLAAESLPGQFPRPTQSIPMKSASNTQTKIQKLAQVSDINKENINNGGGKVEPKKDKVKKNTIDVDILDGTSLRKLTKMLKEKLQITNNSMNNEDKNVTKEPVGKTRPALQTLPENRMPANGEAEN